MTLQQTLQEAAREKYAEKCYVYPVHFDVESFLDQIIASTIAAVREATEIHGSAIDASSEFEQGWNAARQDQLKRFDELTSEQK